MYKVLIVDDEMIVRHAVRTLIRWENSRFEYVGSAANGVVALEMVQKMQPDIIITDIKMSEMDGLELIKQLVRSHFDGEVLVLSNYNDFDLVREALKCGAHDYMLKLTLKTDEFMSTLEEMAVKLDGKRTNSKTQNLKEASEETKTNTDIICEWLEQVDSNISPTDKLVGREVVMKWFTGNSAICNFAFSIQVLKDSLHSEAATEYRETLNKIAEGLFPVNHGLYIVTTDPARFLLLVISPDPLSSEGLPIAEEMAKRIKGLSKIYYNVEVTVTYGNPATTYESLIEQIRLNKEANYLSFYFNHQENCIFNECMKGYNEEDNDFRKLENQLRESLRHANGTEIDLWFENAFKLVQASADYYIKPTSLKRDIIGMVWGLANSKIFSIEESWNESEWISKIEAADTDSKLTMIVQNLYERIINIVGKNTDQKYIREEIRLAIAYLEKHYSTRVSVSDIAAHVGFSEPYLCQVFKTETGYSILSYLNEIRMTKAYEMLSSGNYLIKQVALEIGIPDPFYFNRLFKKRYGVAPKSIKKNQNDKMDNINMD